MQHQARAFLLSLTALCALAAQDPKPAPAPVPAPAAKAEAPEPAPVVRQHELALQGKTLRYKTTTGRMPIRNAAGETEAWIFYTAYTLDGVEDAAKRKLVFSFNGGPGSSSVWLHLGAIGPMRVKLNDDGSLPAPPYQVVPNEGSWLDQADLVFIDPVGTGYSRFVATGDDARKRFFSTDGDVASIALTIRRWLEKSGRLLSPKFVAGESYGGIRGPKIVRNLQVEQGVGVKGLILISPVLDFREFTGSSLLQYVISLPSMAAVERETKGTVTRADMADVENYARGDFLLDLVKGQADTAATNRLADKVAALTGIDQALSRRLAGRFDVVEFRREFDRKNGKVTGRYDASVKGIDPFPDSSFFHFNDPSGEALLAPLTSAAVDLTTRKLNWRPDGSYHLLNGEVEKAWDFGHGVSPPQSVSELRQILALDPKLKLLIGHGLFDLATPYFGTRIELDQLPAFASPDRVKLVVYPGGHMFYSRDASRRAFRTEAEALMK